MNSCCCWWFLFLPFPIRLLGEYIGEDEPERVAVTIYGISLFLVSVLVSALWRFAVRERLIRPDIADTDVRMITRRLAPGLAGYLVVIVVWLFFAGAGRLRGTKIASFDSPLVKIATAWW